MSLEMQIMFATLCGCTKESDMHGMIKPDRIGLPLSLDVSKAIEEGVPESRGQRWFKFSHSDHTHHHFMEERGE